MTESREGSEVSNGAIEATAVYTGALRRPVKNTAKEGTEVATVTASTVGMKPARPGTSLAEVPVSFVRSVVFKVVR